MAITKNSFKAKIQIIGINPYVLLPVKTLKVIFQQAGKEKGPIPVHGKINGKSFIQTLVKYSDKWRLYLNNPMRLAGECDVGDTARFTIAYDPKPRIIKMHPKLKTALNKNAEAKSKFDKLTPHYRKEIMRYINNLKSEETVDKNVAKAIYHLTGKARFVGRNPTKLNWDDNKNN